MGVFASVIAPVFRATYEPWDDFWFQKDPRGSATESGYPVSPDTAMRLSTVYACVGLISDMVGSLPLLVYRRLDNEGKERATTNPLYNVLKRQPNPRQTSKDWRTMGAAHLLLRGNFYNRIEFDRRGAVTALEPMHPDRVTVTLTTSGHRAFVYRPPTGPQQPLTQDEVFHVMGLSLDGLVGCSVIEYARESIGAAQAQEGFAARFWSQGAEGHLAFVAPAMLSDKAREQNEKALQARVGGWRQAHKAILLEGGIKPERISVSGRDSQYIESRKFSVSDIARFFRVPPHMVGDVDGSTSWGTGIEQQTIGFVNFTLLPWLVAFEQSIDRDLILDERHFAEFLVDGLLRGEAGSRATAHRQYVDGGIKSVNEVRIVENLNPIPGEEFDRPHRAGNMGGEPGGGDPATTRRPASGPRPPPAEPEDDDVEGAAFRGIVVNAATRLVRKETAAIRKWAPRFASDSAGWQKWVTEFYGRYAGDLEAALATSSQMAREYCEGHRASLLRVGVKVAEEWDQYQPAMLAELAMADRTTEESHGG